jgi:hypothetical protein
MTGSMSEFARAAVTRCIANAEFTEAALFFSDGSRKTGAVLPISLFFDREGPASSTGSRK